MQRQFLISQTSEFAAKLDALDRQRAQKEAERATIAATISKLDATIPILQQRVDIRKGLTDKELVSKITYLETLHQLVDQQQERRIQESRHREAEAALAAIIKTIAQAEAEYRRTLSSDLVEAERKVAGLSEDLVKAEQRTKFQALTAPVAGMVQQLAVHTIGGGRFSSQSSWSSSRQPSWGISFSPSLRPSWSVDRSASFRRGSLWRSMTPTAHTIDERRPARLNNKLVRLNNKLASIGSSPGVSMTLPSSPGAVKIWTTRPMQLLNSACSTNDVISFLHVVALHSAFFYSLYIFIGGKVQCR
jgi:hypothetical protein